MKKPYLFSFLFLLFTFFINVANAQWKQGRKEDTKSSPEANGGPGEYFYTDVNNNKYILNINVKEGGYANDGGTLEYRAVSIAESWKIDLNSVELNLRGGDAADLLKRITQFEEILTGDRSNAKAFVKLPGDKEYYIVDSDEASMICKKLVVMFKEMKDTSDNKKNKK